MAASGSEAGYGTCLPIWPNPARTRLYPVEPGCFCNKRPQQEPCYLSNYWNEDNRPSLFSSAGQLRMNPTLAGLCPASRATPAASGSTLYASCNNRHAVPNPMTPLNMKWRPLGDSNPCYRRERAMSWATRRRGRKSLQENLVEPGGIEPPTSTMPL